MKPKNHRYELVTRRVTSKKCILSAEKKQMVYDTIALLILTATAITLFILLG